MPKGKSPVVHGFIIAVELSDPKVEPQAIMSKLGDSVRFMEGIAKIEVDWMGEIEIVDKEDGEGGEVTLTDQKGPDAKSEG